MKLNTPARQCIIIKATVKSGRFNRVLKDYVHLALLEQQPLETAVLEYLAVYRSTPHKIMGVPPAVLLHGRAPPTMLDWTYLDVPAQSFLRSPDLKLSNFGKG